MMKKIALMLLGGIFIAQSTFAEARDVYEPQLSHGAYVDTYLEDTEGTLSPETNPAVRIVRNFYAYWQPGEDGFSGRRLRPDILDFDLRLLEKYTDERTAEDEAADYFDERRNIAYSLVTGFGSYAPSYVDGSGIYTILTELPEIGADTLPPRLVMHPAGDPEAALGACVRLAEYFGTWDLPSLNAVKPAYRYLRPFRRAETVKLNPYVAGADHKNAATDYGYTSGHTMRAYLIGLGYAYMFPQRYQAFLARAEEIGFSRIRAGRHNCLDVMGGRMIGTANAAALLNDPEYAEIKREAYKAAQWYLAADANASDDFVDEANVRALYEERLTYHFPVVNDEKKPMVVPKGAEVLLETRFPYLTKRQIRTVLYTTGSSSGYPVIDDEEGWGRLNLYAAADGYASFPSDTVVTMQRSDGGFSARDVWKNDISGAGGLVKGGSGTLVLAGGNTYTGGTRIEAGVIEAANRKALGCGNVDVAGGVLAESVDGVCEIMNDFSMTGDSNLVLTVSGPEDIIKVEGAARLGGVLSIRFASSRKPVTQRLMYAEKGIRGAFSRIETDGLADGVNADVVQKGKSLWLIVSGMNGVHEDA